MKLVENLCSAVASDDLHFGACADLRFCGMNGVLPDDFRKSGLRLICGANVRGRALLGSDTCGK